MIAMMGTILVPLITHYRSLSPTVQAALAGGLRLSRPKRAQIVSLAKALRVREEVLAREAGYADATLGDANVSFDQPFPVETLSPEGFERFTYCPLGMLYPDAVVHFEGGRGHSQEGIDIEVIHKNGERTGHGLDHLTQLKHHASAITSGQPSLSEPPSGPKPPRRVPRCRLACSFCEDSAMTPKRGKNARLDDERELAWCAGEAEPPQ